MVANEKATDRCGHDQRVYLADVSWAQLQTLLEIRGERSIPRVTYLEGALELMTPSIDHEAIKTAFARLVEAFAEEMGLDLNGYGSWTLGKEASRGAVEPDECYVLGSHRPEAPDVAIEVVWTHGGLDKLEVYRKLGVREVWIWEDDRIGVHALRRDGYEEIARSEVLPGLDLALLATFLRQPSQSEAVRAYRAALRGASRP